MAPSDLETLIRAPRRPTPGPAPLAALAAAAPHLAPLIGPDLRHSLEAIIAEIDRQLALQLDAILHHPQFQQLEASWRALRLLVGGVETGPLLKIRLLDISKRELARSLRKFRGTAWDTSPLFRRVYEEEYGQLGGAPFGVLIGDFAFDHRPEDVQLLADIAQVAAAAHTPFIAAAAPSLLQMDDWAEIADRRDPTRILRTAEYAAWRALRDSEDSRYIGLCLPRFLARRPYGARSDPVDRFEFEETVDGPDRRGFLWANACWVMGLNIARAFSLYAWCVRIRGLDGGGLIEDLPSIPFPTADGDVDRRCSVEVALTERREAELSRQGLIALLHVKGSSAAAFVSVPSLQQPREYEDPAATLNAAISAKLPYMFACCRFAHYLKCMVRTRIGGTVGRAELQEWLDGWLHQYVDDAPAVSDDQWKAEHPLADAGVVVEPRMDAPGEYEARFFVRPHFQLEGLSAALRLVTRLNTG